MITTFKTKLILNNTVLGQLNSAGLYSSLIVNRWSEVFDFTPSSLSNNWKFLAVEDRLEDKLNEVELIHCAK